MNISDLVKAALTLIVGFLLHLVFVAIKVEIDPVLFDTIVAGIVTYFLALFFHQVTIKVFPSLVQRGLLKE
jgi:hypothetical protein